MAFCSYVGESCAISISESPELTKQDIRQRVWDYLEEKNIANFPRPVHHRIPNFKGASEAAYKVAPLDAFKQANTVKVNPDKPQETVRLLTLEANKMLLVPIPRLRNGLFQHIVLPPGSGKQELKIGASRQGLEKWGRPMGLDAKVKVDLVVLGSVAVSKSGYRLGKGEGYADLEYAMMVGMGAVNEETIVVSTVHDCQVFDSLPPNIFGKHDVPVDYIVTPTQVIEVEPRLPKPTGILWNQLTAKKLNEIPILRTLRANEQRLGKDVTLKDGEDYPVTNDNEDANGRDGNQTLCSENLTITFSVDKRNRILRRKVTVNPDTDSTEARKDSSGQQRGNNPSWGKARSDQNSPRNTVRRETEVFSVHVGGIPKDARVRDLKDALHERGVRPLDITWKGQKGFAFLHFSNDNTPEGVIGLLQDVKLKEGILKCDIARHN